MDEVGVGLKERSYRILIDSGLLDGEGARAALAGAVAGRRCLVVTDTNVGPLYAERVAARACQAGATGCPITAFPAGESSKTLATLAGLYSQAVAARLDRQSVVLAVGGGVVGDVAGLLAATFLRGLAWIQVPTSLLAMVDSSVGGKVAVDLPEGKNLVGAFHQPRLVLADLSCLGSLPARERRCGLAEVVKYGVILDAAFFGRLEEWAERLRHSDAAEYRAVVRRSCELKAQVVQEDETETSGRREVLNYGHTFGHALETLGGYTRLNHGEGVAVGMGMAADLAADLGLVPAALAARQDALLERLGLPRRVALPGVSAADVLAAMGKDKKARQGRVRLVLPRRLGLAESLECADRDRLLAVIGGRCGEP